MSRRRGNLGLRQNRKKTITGGANTTDTADGGLFMGGAGDTEDRVDVPDMLEMAIRDASMRRERLMRSHKRLGLFCRVRICRDTQKTKSD